MSSVLTGHMKLSYSFSTALSTGCVLINVFVHLAVRTRFNFVWKFLCSVNKLSCINVHLLIHAYRYINNAPYF